MLHLTWRALRFISGNTVKLETPTGPVWHRYNDDGYGDHEDGASLDGAGIGRGRPLLTGKRMCRTEHRKFRCSLRDERVIHLPLQAVQRYLIEKTVSRREMWIHIADLTTKRFPKESRSLSLSTGQTLIVGTARTSSFVSAPCSGIGLRLLIGVDPCKASLRRTGSFLSISPPPSRRWAICFSAMVLRGAGNQREDP